MKNPALYAPGVPSAESCEAVEAHMKRTREESAMSATRIYADGQKVKVRDFYIVSDWHSAKVVSAYKTSEYGWVYIVAYSTHRPGIPTRVSGQRVRPAGKSAK